MLPRAKRLTNSKEIERASTRGKSFFTKILGIKYAPSRSPTTRFAVVAGLKVSKKSAKRNRPKRQIREALRKNTTSIKPGYDVVVIARKEILGQKYKAIEGALLYALRSARLLK